MQRTLFDDTHEDFRASFRRFLEREVVPHHEQWERDGIVPRELFSAPARTASWPWRSPSTTAAPA